MHCKTVPSEATDRCCSVVNVACVGVTEMACLGSSGRQGLSVAIGSRAFHSSNSHISYKFLCRLLVQQKASLHPSVDCHETCITANAGNNLNCTSNGSDFKSQYVVSASSSKNTAPSHIHLRRRSLHVWPGTPRAVTCTTMARSMATSCCIPVSYISTVVSAYLHNYSIYIVCDSIMTLNT